MKFSASATSSYNIISFHEWIYIIIGISGRVKFSSSFYYAPAFHTSEVTQCLNSFADGSLLLRMREYRPDSLITVIPLFGISKIVISDFRAHSHFGNLSLFCILHFHFAYAIMPVGEKKWWVHVDKKNEALSSANTGGFFLFIYSGQVTARLVLPYLSPSNHLQT